MSIRLDDDDDIEMMSIENKLQNVKVATIDVSLLSKSTTPQTRSLLITQIRKACQHLGCFHIVNHGVGEQVMEDALDLNSKFFDLPMADKQYLLSHDIYKPVRFGQIQGDTNNPGGGGRFSRDFLKLYAHPIHHFLPSWPTRPPLFRDKMEIYAKELRRLGIEIFGAIMESLDLEPTYLRDELERGMHIMAINRYPPSSQSNLKMGIPPHSDHSIITLLLQSCPGLQVMSPVTGTWYAVPELKGSIQVIVGDHLEVISNGLYKSLLHRAVPDHAMTRLSIVSLHSLAIDEIVEPCEKLVDEERPKGYKASSVMDFLNHQSSEQEKTFIETLKIKM